MGAQLNSPADAAKDKRVKALGYLAAATHFYKAQEYRKAKDLLLKVKRGSLVGHHRTIFDEFLADVELAQPNED